MKHARRALKRLVRYWLRDPSVVGHTARVLYRRYHLWIVSYYAWANRRKHETTLPIDPFEILWANPARIIHWVVGMRGVPRTSWRRIGSVESGDWDLKLGEFDKLESYVGLYEHFVEGTPWRETVLFRTVTARLATGTVEWGCMTADQFAERCAEIDVLYETIRKSGYKSQKELSASGRRTDPISHIQLDRTLRLVDEIAVCLSRTGEFLLADGQHRLSLAKILQLPSVPLRVVVRHAEWQRFREELASFIRIELKGALPHALPHPDLNWHPSSLRSSEWFQLVRDHTASEAGTVLEVDAGISGYFASRFEQCGFQSFALEQDPAKADWLRRARDSNGDNFEVISSHAQARGRRYDVVIRADPGEHDSGHLTQKITELAPLASSELWFTQRSPDAADPRRSLQPTESLLVDQLGFAELTVMESPALNGHVLVRASRTAGSISSRPGSLQRTERQPLRIAAAEPVPVAARGDAARIPRPQAPRPAVTAPREQRLKILISAYACSPHRGSEPGIGWNNAREAARRNEVWLLTRPVFRRPIEAELQKNPMPSLHPVFYDLPEWMRILGPKPRYYLWQVAIYFFARRLHNVFRFDVSHHVSYVRSWSPSLLAFLPIPFIWGPVGGGETVPASFRRGLSLRGRMEELQRDVGGRLSLMDPLLRYTARRSAITIANSAETAARVKRIGSRRVTVMGESCLDELPLEPPGEELDFGTTPTRFGSLTRLVYWKGLHLALEAFARVGDPSAEYWIIGEGPEAKRLHALAEKLGVAERIVFREGLSRREWMAALRQIDALLHPCICNTGNAITLEAMAAGRPVVCLDRGGVAMQITDDTGFKIPADTPEEAVAGLERAMKIVIADRERAAAMGRTAREWSETFSWKERGELMQSLYEEATGSRPGTRARTSARPGSPVPPQQSNERPRLLKTGQST
ncbi:hypothetical protein BH23GEM2_BH23GEM2_11530 [soil metagenome]